MGSKYAKLRWHCKPDPVKEFMIRQGAASSADLNTEITIHIYDRLPERYRPSVNVTGTHFAAPDRHIIRLSGNYLRRLMAHELNHIRHPNDPNHLHRSWR